MSDLFNTALSEYGVTEIKGASDNARIVQYFDDLGFDGSQLKDETAWCSAFANWCAKTAGYEHTNKLNARSWLAVGEPTDSPSIGDVVIFWRESKQSWKGHVAFFVAERDGFIYVLGGNQSNQVNIKPYPVSRLLEYRKLRKTN